MHMAHHFFNGQTLYERIQSAKVNSTGDETKKRAAKEGGGSTDLYARWSNKKFVFSS